MKKILKVSVIVLAAALSLIYSGCGRYIANERDEPDKPGIIGPDKPGIIGPDDPGTEPIARPDGIYVAVVRNLDVPPVFEYYGDVDELNVAYSDCNGYSIFVGCIYSEPENTEPLPEDEGAEPQQEAETAEPFPAGTVLNVRYRNAGTGGMQWYVTYESDAELEPINFVNNAAEVTFKKAGIIVCMLNSDNLNIILTIEPTYPSTT